MMAMFSTWPCLLTMNHSLLQYSLVQSKH